MMDTLVPRGYCKKLRIKIGITLSKISSKINIKNSVIYNSKTLLSRALKTGKYVIKCTKKK